MIKFCLLFLSAFYCQAQTWGIQDVWIQCNTSSPGTLITTTIFGNCLTTGMTGSSSTLTGNAASAMGIAASHQAMGGSISVNGTTYPIGTADFSISFNHQYNFSVISWSLPSSVSIRILNANGFITFAPPTQISTFPDYDYIVLAPATVSNYATLQLQAGPQGFSNTGYSVGLETFPGNVVTDSSSGILVTPGNTYAFSMQINTVTGLAQLALADPVTFAQLGSVSAPVSVLAADNFKIFIGNNEVGAGAQPTYTSYFENLMVDWSQHQAFPNFPAIPLGGGSISSGQSVTGGGVTR